MATGLLTAVASCSVDPSVDNSVVFVVERDGPRSNEDAVLRDRLAGDMVPAQRLLVAAACHNLLAWYGDLTLGTSIVVASEPGLVRAAEMIDEHRYGRATVERYETAWLLDGDGHGTGGTAQQRYLGDRATMPTVESSRRFVAYVTNTTTTHQRLIVIDTERFRPASIPGGATLVGPIKVGLADGRTVEVDPDSCEDLVADQPDIRG